MVFVCISHGRIDIGHGSVIDEPCPAMQSVYLHTPEHFVELVAVVNVVDVHDHGHVIDGDLFGAQVLEVLIHGGRGQFDEQVVIEPRFGVVFVKKFGWFRN